MKEMKKKKRNQDREWEKKNYQSIIGASQLDLNFFSSCWDKIL